MRTLTHHRLAETYREFSPSVMFGILLLLIAIFPNTDAFNFTIDSNFLANCTEQLQCGRNGLVCIGGICQYCTESNQCQTIVGNMYRCIYKNVNSTAVWEAATNATERFEHYGQCLHKYLFKPFHWRDILTALILFIGSCVAAGAGVGGGGLNVAMLVFIDGFTTTSAIPLSSVMIGGAAIANFIHALPRQRLTAPRPLIDYHTSLLLQPLMLGGSIIGILLNRLLPDWLILLILIITLAFTLYTTTLKFIRTWRADYGNAPTVPKAPMVPIQDDESTVELELQDGLDPAAADPVRLDFDQMEVKAANGTTGGELKTESEEPSNEHPPSTANADNGVSELQINPTETNYVAVRAELEAEEQKIPWGKLWACFGILIAITLHSILLGGKGGPSIVGIRTCTPVYWVLLWGIFPILGVASFFIGRNLVQRYRLKRSYDFKFLHSDIEWTDRRTYNTMAISLVAGILSSLLGVGGGMLVNPLLLEMGVSPDCTAATSSLMILFTSISAVAQYGIIGRIQWDYAGFLFVLGLAGSIVGQHVLGSIVKKYKSQAWILLAMLLIIIPGGTLLVISAITSIIASVRAGTGMGFKNLCG